MVREGHGWEKGRWWEWQKWLRMDPIPVVHQPGCYESQPADAISRSSSLPPPAALTPNAPCIACVPCLNHCRSSACSRFNPHMSW